MVTHNDNITTNSSRNNMSIKIKNSVAKFTQLGSTISQAYIGGFICITIT